MKKIISNVYNIILITVCCLLTVSIAFAQENGWIEIGTETVITSKYNTVTFEQDDETLFSKYIKTGSEIGTLPEIIPDEQNVFDGWYSDDFKLENTTIVNSDITAKAHFLPNPFRVITAISDFGTVTYTALGSTEFPMFSFPLSNIIEDQHHTTHPDAASLLSFSLGIDGFNAYEWKPEGKINVTILLNEYIDVTEYDEIILLSGESGQIPFAPTIINNRLFAIGFTIDKFENFFILGEKYGNRTVIEEEKETEFISIFIPGDAFKENFTYALDEVSEEEKDLYFSQIQEILPFSFDIIDMFDINFVDKDGAELQPSVPVTINVELKDEYESAAVIHFAGEEHQPVIVKEGITGSSFSFEAESFSVYAIVATTLSETVNSSDGNTYEIEVRYRNSSGIPMEGTALLVSELKPGDTKYDEYIAASAAKVGTKAENIELSRVFDIQIVDENDHSVVYEPVDDVKVSIRLVGETLNDYANLNVFHFVESENTEGFTVYDMDSIVDGETVQFTTDSFSVYVVAGYTIEKIIEASDGNTYKITVAFNEDTELSEGVDLAVSEFTGEEYENYVGRTAASINVASFDYARVFDISIVDREGTKIQLSVPVEVTIELMDTSSNENVFTVMHFAIDEADPDKKEQAELMNAYTNENIVVFKTSSFSAYAIVQGPTAIPTWWHKVTSIDELTASTTGFYIGHPDGYYYGNTLVNDGRRVGITKTKPAQSYPASAAALYYFEQVEGQTNQVYVYCYTADNTKQYVYNGGNNSLSFTDESTKTAFTVTKNSDGTFTLNNGSWYWNMQSGVKGTRFCSYNSANDGNNKVNFWSYININEDPYELNNKSFGLMNWSGAPMGRAMMASSTTDGSLDAKSLIVMSTSNNYSRLFVPKESDIFLWMFHWTNDEDKYTISTSVDGSILYLKIDNAGLYLVSEESEASVIQVIPGAGNLTGQICLKSGDITLTFSGTVEEGFSVDGSAGSEWLYLVNESELTSDYFMTHSASKVSVSDSSITNGSRVIVYTRVWNDTTKKYEFYAIDSDGSLVRCYENGDSIQWVGGLLNTMLWDFVEYYWEGTSDPNYYYELKNEYSGLFIAPQFSGDQILSGSTIGLNLPGRKDNYYYSKIVAWDDGYYSYTGLKADLDTGKIASCSLSEADDFYFAIVQDLPVDDDLTTVSTVDHTQYGITIKIKDFDATGPSIENNPMSAFLGNGDGGIGTTLHQGLLSTNLTNGYPTASGGSLSQLYSGAQEVNYLFIASTYSGSGYYEYDSSQNFASLNTATGSFTVYKEIASYDSGKNKNSLKHGQFFPFNDIKPGVFAVVNGENLYSATGTILPDSDPRKNERLYSIEHDGQKANCYFAVEIEAQFTQTANGKDNWGHDIIYEFTGDDDFWLYVDGELIIDLGGIHSAVGGKVNYATGEVEVNGLHYTLRELFESNYRGRNPGATDAEVNAYLEQYFDEGNTIFKDYTTHTMRIFYMERGASASNLHMRFNLASVQPGHVLLTKELAGIEKDETVMAEFPYQIYYKMPGDETDYPLSNSDPLSIKVFYKDTDIPVAYRETLEIDGIDYSNIFLLKPGEVADIAIPDDAISYKIVECGVDTAAYSNVTVLEDTVTETTNSNRADYALNYVKISERPRVTYVNTVKPTALRTLSITKKLYREDGVTEITDDGTEFSFRLYLATPFTSENLSDSPTNMQTYHVKNRVGEYCKWEAASQKFVSLGVTNYSDLTTEQKEQATFNTSINGAITRIPAGYTVEIRNVLAGTQYKVVERPWEIPDGYSFQKYVLNGAISDNSAITGISGTIETNADATVEVCNLSGWGLRVNKIWSDAEYVTERDATYFAVFTDNGTGHLTIVPETAVVKDENGDDTTIVRQLPYGKTSIYWYFPQLPVSAVTSLNNYVIREVTLSDGYYVDTTTGKVTLYGATVTPVSAGGSLTFRGKQNSETATGSFTYTVVYETGTVEAGSQVRTDTVGNNRPGILLKKTDWTGNPLAGATFELRNNSDDLLGTFTSASDGTITTAFLSNDGSTYTLTETNSPQGYWGIPMSITISQSDGTYSVSGLDDEYFLLSQGVGVSASLTIINRDYTFAAIKADAETKAPLEGVKFALYMQKTVGGVTSFGTSPMEGYENLITDSNGVIPKLNNMLPAGTYQLREIQPMSGYQQLSGYIEFTVNPTGAINLNSTNEATLTSEVSTDSTMGYTITVLNEKVISIPPAPTGLKLNNHAKVFLITFAVAVLFVLWEIIRRLLREN